MTPKRFLLTSLVLFLVYMAMAVVVHGVWLGPSYTTLAGDVWRPQSELMAKAWIVHGTTVLYCLAFVYFFSRGHRGGGWREGAWFGLVAYVFTGFQAVLHAYATYPLPLDLALKWLAAGLVISVISGILVSRLYRAA